MARLTATRSRAAEKCAGAIYDRMATIIYNDTCPICSREVASYRRAAQRAGADFGFDGLAAAERFGLTTDEAARRFHVVEDGRLFSGLDAFLVVWRRLPRWRWLAEAIDRPVVRPLARLAYDGAAAPALYALHRLRVRRRAARR